MDLNLVERLTDGIFSKALQVRRMIQRGSADCSAGACSCPTSEADLRESLVDERVAGVLSEHDIERFRGWPAALVIAARKL